MFSLISADRGLLNDSFRLWTNFDLRTAVSDCLGRQLFACCLLEQYEHTGRVTGSAFFALDVPPVDF